MGLNFILMCVGLVICFGGIYFRKICSGIMGLIWGALLGIVAVAYMAISSGSIWSLMSHFEDDTSIMIIIIVAIVGCALSAWLDRLCAAINTFISSFFAALMFACLFAENMDELSVIIVLSLIVAGLLGFFAYIYYNYAFMLVTAFSGAYIATLGGLGLISNTEFSKVLYSLFIRGDREAGIIVAISTFILGCLGFFVQMSRFKQVYILGNTNVAKKKVHFGQMNFSADKIAGGAKKAKETANPYLNEIGDQFKNAWDELRTKQGRNTLKNEVSSNKLLFIAPIVQFLIVPIIFNILYSIAFISVLYQIVYWISVVAEAVSVGILAYVVITKDTKFNFVYQLPYFFGYLIFSFTFFQYVTFFAAIVHIFKFAIIWLVLIVASRIIKKKEIQPLILSVTAFLMYYFVTNWLATFYVYFYIDWNVIVKLLVCIGVVYAAFKINYGINMFNFKVSSKMPDIMRKGKIATEKRVTYRCPKCNRVFYGQANFCDECGGTLQKVCGYCGNAVDINDSFCRKCGKTL